MAKLAMIDTTLTRGQLCVWRGRLDTRAILPYLRQLDEAGFAAIEILSPSQFEYCVREIGENPFDRIRLAAERLKATPINVWTRGRFLFSDMPVANDVVAEAIAAIAAAGARRLTCYDPVNDIASLAPSIHAAKARDMVVSGAIVYGLSQHYDVAKFVELAGKLKAEGVDSVCLFDPAGVLQPDAARSLLSVLVETLAPIPLELAIHCRSGRAEICALEAVSAGVEVIHTASPPVAGGPSFPSAPYLATNLGRDGVDMDVTAGTLDAMADYFGALRELHGWPAAEHALPDVEADRHQMPLIQSAWMEAAVPDGSHAARRAEILKEVASIREDVGQIPMTSPIARAIVAQAKINAIARDRYETLDAGFQTLLRGDLGPIDGDVDELLLQKVDSLPGEAPLPMTRAALEALTADSDGLVIAACCGLEALNGVKDIEAGDIADIATPMDLLETELAGMERLKALSVMKGSDQFEWQPVRTS